MRYRGPGKEERGKAKGQRGKGTLTAENARNAKKEVSRVGEAN